MQSTGGHFTKFFEGQTKGFLLGISITVVLIIGFFDYITPYQFSMSIFYTAPILLAAWYCGKKGADLTAIIALLVTWWTDELTAPPEALGWIHTYRMCVRLFFFLFISMGASAFRARHDLTIAQINLLEHSRQLEREIIKISEREQQRIGQDLHDGLCQYLAALTCAATSLKNDLQKHSLDEETRSAAEIAELLKQGVTQARNLARGLSPVHDDESGLDSALQELTLGASRLMNIDCEYESAPHVRVRDNVTASHLYRIAQESLNNATRHGGATRVTIEILEKDDLVILRVTDNGKGLPNQPGKGGGMGLKIMDYRARLIGGMLQVSNKPHGGVTVTCSFHQERPPAAAPAITSAGSPSSPLPGKLEPALTA